MNINNLSKLKKYFSDDFNINQFDYYIFDDHFVITFPSHLKYLSKSKNLINFKHIYITLKPSILTPSINITLFDLYDKLTNMEKNQLIKFISNKFGVPINNIY